MLAFGGHLTVSNVANYLSANLDNFLIGKFIGADGLGIYGKAYQLFFMPIRYFKDPLQNTAMPALISLSNQPDRFRNYYKRFIDLLATLTIPTALYCLVEADFIIRFFLGPQWGEAIPVFRIFALAAIIFPLTGTQSLVLVSPGKSVFCGGGL